MLGVLSRGDSYGFEIFKAIRDATDGAHEIKEATLYASYRRLVRDGLVEAYWGDETQGGRRKYYRITDAGRAEYLKIANGEVARTRSMIGPMFISLPKYGMEVRREPIPEMPAELKQIIEEMK